MSKKGSGKLSKNNAALRNKTKGFKQFDGKNVKPVMYNGRKVGHGVYMAVQFEDNGQIAVDRNGRPVPYSMAVNPL